MLEPPNFTRMAKLLVLKKLCFVVQIAIDVAYASRRWQALRLAWRKLHIKVVDMILCVFTWRHGGRICVPNQSCGSWTLFLCKCWPREWKHPVARRSSLFEARDTYFAPKKVLISTYNRALVETSPWTIRLYLGSSSWIGQETFNPSAAWILKGLETGSCSCGDRSTSSVRGKLLSLFEVELRVF